jgi:hypothetical protein
MLEIRRARLGVWEFVIGINEAGDPVGPRPLMPYLPPQGVLRPLLSFK